MILPKISLRFHVVEELSSLFVFCIAISTNHAQEKTFIEHLDQTHEINGSHTHSCLLPFYEGRIVQTYPFLQDRTRN